MFAFISFLTFHHVAYNILGFFCTRKFKKTENKHKYAICIAARNEETVLGLMLLFENHRKKVFAEALLTEDDFITDLNKRIFSYLNRAYNEEDQNLTTLNEEFTPDEIGRISRMKVRRMELSSNDDAVLFECIDNLKKSVDKKTSEKTDTIDKLNEILSKKRVD